MKNGCLNLNFEYNPRRVALAINDVFKAYDHVNTQYLRLQLHNKNHHEFDDILSCYDNCNLNVGRVNIKRSRGLPQGAKGAPMLFNFYLNNSIGRSLNADFVYADNIVLMKKNAQQLDMETKAIERGCKSVGLSFEKGWDYWAYAKQEVTKDKPKSAFTTFSNIPKFDHPTTRVLGYQLKVQNDTLKEDFNTILAHITYKTPHLPPFKGISFYKQYIKPKYLFHYRDKGIPKNTVRLLIQKITCIRNLPNAYMEINNLCSVGETDYWAKFWSYYVYTQKRMISIPEEADVDQFRRFVMLCQVMDKYYLSIYQITKFILFGKCRLMPVKIDYQSLKNNVKMLDLIWFGLTRRFNESKLRILMELTILNRAKKKLTVTKILPKLN